MLFFSEIGSSDAFVATTTKDGSFYVYEYMFIGVSTFYLIVYDKRMKSVALNLNNVSEIPAENFTLAR